MSHHEGHDDDGGRSRRISFMVFIAFGAIAAYYLITEHRAHLYGALPFLLLAACPLLHLFHHRGHGSGHGGSGRKSDGGEHRH